MPSGRENKKGFRAKATGRSMDTRSNQKPGNNETTDPATITGRVEKRGYRGKTMNLTVDTKVARDTYKAHTPKLAQTPKLARKPSHADLPKLSEALLNRNWRNHRRPQDDIDDHLFANDPIWSAPPEQSSFPAEVNIKPQRPDQNETVNYDRGLERVAYRSIRPDEVKPDLLPFTNSESIDATLCLSAPATKLEFTEADIGGEERSQKYNLGVFQPCQKTLVRLDKMEPVERAEIERIMNWNDCHEYDSVYITTVSPTEISPRWVNIRNDMSMDALEFPYADIRAVEKPQTFETELSGVEESLRRQLANLVEPQTAGLPPEHLRKEYQARREERQKAMSLIKKTGLDNSVAQDRPDSTCSTQTGGKEIKFNDLLGRLNRLCAPRLRALTVDENDAPSDLKTLDPSNKTLGAPEKTKDDAPPDLETWDAPAKPNSNQPQLSPSKDSGVGGITSKRRERSSTLNPEAEEFRCPLLDKSTIAANESVSVVECPPVFVSPAMKVAEMLGSEDPLQQLATRVAELEAELARQRSKKAQPVRHQQPNGKITGNVDGGMWQVNHPANRGGVPYHGMNGNLHGLRSYAVTPPIHQARPGFPAPPGGRPIIPMPAMGPYGPTPNGPAFAGHPNHVQRMGTYQGNGFVARPATAQPMSPYQGNGLVRQTTAMPALPTIPAMPAMPTMPTIPNVPAVPPVPAVSPYNGNGPLAVVAPPVTAPPVAAGPVGTPWWAKAMFGPKPVSKPDRPFRPGDKTQAQRQQEYEEYLEHLRATDPEYAQKCKFRQARRAERQRHGHDPSSENEGIGPD